MGGPATVYTKPKIVLKFEFASRTRKILKIEPTFALKIHCTLKWA
jgi:hypothetical protein